jgi:LETM1 and EF-hand domain-containing protein 1
MLRPLLRKTPIKFIPVFRHQRYSTEEKPKEEELTLLEMAKRSKLAGSLLKPPTFREQLSHYGKQSSEYTITMIKNIPSMLLSLVTWIGKTGWKILSNPKLVGIWWNDTKKATKEMGHHYWYGAKLLWADTKTSVNLLKKSLKGMELSRRERRALLNSVSDMFRLVPLLIVLIVPFLEFALPIALKLFPNMLPRQFEDASQRLIKEEQMKQTLKAKLALAKFLQDTVALMASDLKKNKSGETMATANELKVFIDRVRLGERVQNKDIVKFAKLFSDEITLDNISRPQLVAMCRYMGLSEYGNDVIMRFRLNNKLRRLKADDRLIAWEGVKSLSTEELVYACNVRGMKVSLPKEHLQKQLENWIQLSLDQNIPSSLLILSRAFSLTSSDEAEIDSEAIRDAIGSLPDEVVKEAQNETSIEGDTDVNRLKYEHIQRQNILIEQELKEAATKKVTPPTPEKKLSEEQIMVLGEAIANATKGGLVVEKNQSNRTKSCKSCGSFIAKIGREYRNH